MTRTDAIELTHQLTERKGEKILDMNLLFGSVVMDICKRARFWWRKLDVTFTINPGLSGAGITTYDFSTITCTPSITGIAVEGIIVLALVSGGTIITTTNPPTFPELTPIFDPLGFRAMKQNKTQAQPSRYCMGIDDWKTLRIDPPDVTYTAEMTFMAMPMPSSTGDIVASSNTIPLIPPFYHDSVVNGLCARVNRRVWGANDSRYLDDKASYEECIQRMMMREQFTSNVSKQWISQDDATLNGAVQSTAPNSP